MGKKGRGVTEDEKETKDEYGTEEENGNKKRKMVDEKGKKKGNGIGDEEGM
jgi:hypothetical protein